MRCVTRRLYGSDAERAEASARNTARKRTARAAMTDNDRLLELSRAQRRRIDNARVNRAVRNLHSYTANLGSVKKRVLEQCEHRLSGVLLAELACCVCDCLYAERVVTLLKVPNNKALLAAMRARLQGPPNLPPALVAHYNVSDIIPELRGLLISRAGVRICGGHPIIQVCSSCRSSLSNKTLKHPPKFAIANGLYIGQLPSNFSDTTLTENAMMNLSQPFHYITVVRGGKHTSLRSHAYYFRADPSPPALLLPREVVSSGFVGVTMVGALTSAQKAATLKKYEVRIPRLHDQLKWYQAHNHLYRSLGERPDWEATVSAVQTRVVLDASYNDVPSDAIDRGGSSSHLAGSGYVAANAPHPAHTAVSDRDEECEQASVGFITDFPHVDNSTGVQQAIGRKGVVVHRSSGLLSDFDPAFWTHAFSDLFPYGRGGLDEPRVVPIGLHEFIRYCLRLSSRKHAQHPSFPLVAFDIIARHNALQAIYIKAKMHPHVMRSIASVPREVLEEYISYQQERLRALTQLSTPRDPPMIDSRLKDLYSSISSGMRAYWGSNDERAQDRKEVFSLQLHYGQPTIFFTLSPDSSSTFRVGALAGAVPMSVLQNIETSVHDCLTFTRARLGQIATSNPYVCAKFFDIVMRVFIDVVLSWDSERECARQEPGLFGRTKAFYASTESQSSTGSLHAHMLIWIDGMPTTVEEYYDLCVMDAFRTAMVDYVDALVKSRVPVDMHTCPKCGSSELQSVPLEKKAFKKPRAGALRPTTVMCGNCRASYGADELIVGNAERVERDGAVPAVTDDGVFRDIASTTLLPCEPEPSSVHAARVARALVFYQHHHWCHAKSCFKITKRTPRGNVCRMFMPKEPCERSRWTPENVMELRRDPGNEYVNTYAPVINAVFKCNHDVKFLSAGEGPEKAFYMMKYATKPQQSVENPWALHLHAYDKARQRDVDPDEDPIIVGRRISQSMCCNISNPQEVSAPMACLYLIRSSAVYSSHKFVRLNLTSILKAVFHQDQAVEFVLEADNERRRFTLLGVWQDYIYRPANLEDLTLMAFVSTWERRKSKCGLRFDHSHPLHTTHSLYRRGGHKVVVVCHKRLPDTRREDLTSEERLRFRQSILVLFCPFRSQGDLADRIEESGDGFRHWWNHSAPSAARTFVENNADYYASRELAKDSKDVDVARYFAYEGEDEDPDEVSLEDGEDDDDLVEEGADHDHDEMGLMQQQPTKYVDMFNKTTHVAELAAMSTLDNANIPSFVNMSLEQVEECVRTIQNTDVELPNHGAATITTYPDLPTRVCLLEGALRGKDQAPSANSTNAGDGTDPVAGLNVRPSLSEVSSAFGLNVKQHSMFASMGAALLTSALVGHKTTDQTIAFLGGLPGAGKSRVISALQCLALKWNASESIATAAYQGVAAQAANGQTIHKLFGWFVNSKKRWVPTQKQRERFAQLRLLILDEVSTCDVKILGMVDKSLRELLDRPSCVFGGVHVLLVGDWLQQLPVAGQPAFKNAAELLHPSSRQKEDYLNRVRGANAYQHVNRVVILTENMRHRGDPMWRDMLQKWRVGLYEQGDLDLVNSIAFEENWSSSRKELKGYCPVIVTSNALRVEFNRIALRAFCKAAKVSLHRFPGVVTRSRRPLSMAQQRSLLFVRDDKSNGMPIMLEFAVGSMAQCTKNVSPSLKLANGSIGTVVGFTQAEGDTVQVRVVDSIEEHVHSQPPEVVFLKLKDFASHSFSPQLPLGVVPIPRRTERGVCIKFEQRSFSVAISQVPLVPAYSLTSEKCQGLTVDKMVLAPLRHQTRRIPQRSSFYVAVTRVKSLRQLYIMSPLTMEYLSYFKPYQDALGETIRLQEIENRSTLPTASLGLNFQTARSSPLGARRV